ncbi:hypothetical protein DFH06DRAFT_1133786 [Mycena polygramma]|nr:hypothetical protein DFH06DRAFT_1133785 [Mycena polygramma]KAJ7653637.1 hypothetical protein DFH06DRAFT_1133786 [Mycena polygramma]
MHTGTHLCRVPRLRPIHLPAHPALVSVWPPLGAAATSLPTTELASFTTRASNLHTTDICTFQTPPSRAQTRCSRPHHPLPLSLSAPQMRSAKARSPHPTSHSSLPQKHRVVSRTAQVAQRVRVELAVEAGSGRLEPKPEAVDPAVRVPIIGGKAPYELEMEREEAEE